MRKNRVVVAILIVAMAVQFFVLPASAKKITELDSSVPFVAIYKAGSYGEYLQRYARAASAETVIDIDLKSFTDSENVKIDSYEGRSGVLVTEETGYVEYTVDVPATGLYGLGCSYYPTKGKGVAIERIISVNGEVPYTEANTAALDRIFDADVDWSQVSEPDEEGIRSGYFVEDLDGNQVRPSSVEIFRWLDDSYFRDSTGAYNGALQFYLEKGQNTIRLTSSREPAAFSSLYLYGVESPVSYTEFLAANADYMTEGSDRVAKIQAEYPTAKSTTSVYADYDRSSAATEPESSSQLKYNVIGGSSWKSSGQWLEYKVNVPKAGLYKIALRARQNTTSGTFSSREILVNGQNPVSEATRVRFPYSSSWEMYVPADVYGTEILFKFEEGENTIRITATTGELSDYINAVDTVVDKLNSDYRRIMQITGTDPDEYRDYKLDEEIPEVISDLKAQGDVLMSVYNNLIEILGGNGQQTAIIQNTVNILYDMAEDPDKIPSYFSNFKNQITNLGSWLNTMRDQPLSIDYIIVAQPDYKVGSADVNFFKNLWHNIVMFASSFTSDTNNIGATSELDFDHFITVWTTTSKDRAQIKQRLIERSFISQYEIGVNMELVPSGALLPSIFAGKGPDIVLGLGDSDVINYASRNALIALSDFDDFAEISKRFAPSALTPTTLEVYADETHTTTVKKNYGLPETQNFHVMFYRQDVLKDMGVEPPKTWDEVYDLIAVMKKRYMDFAPPDFVTVLYQRGETIYKNNGCQINLDSETAIQSFITVTDYYITYNCPKSYNFQNRFRFGEMPVGMADYTFYNTLSVAAPEIKGFWSFTTVPGTVQEDGSVDYTTYATVASACMLKDVKTRDEASPGYMDECWQFLSWWTSEEAQVEFGTELEATLGVAARYNTANQAAAQRLPWTTQELTALMDQWGHTLGHEQYVGNYYYTRYYSFAFNEVLDDYTDARETLLNYVQEINKEIKYKREQLNLPYSDSID